MKQNENGKLSLRYQPGNKNRHLWNNNGTFWCHLTLHLPDFTKQRVRLSLGTRDLQHARKRRDEVIRTYADGKGRSSRVSLGTFQAA